MLVADPDCEKLHIGHTKNTQTWENRAFLYLLFYEVFFVDVDVDVKLESQPYMIFVLFFSQAKPLAGRTFKRLKCQPLISYKQPEYFWTFGNLKVFGFKS